MKYYIFYQIFTILYTLLELSPCKYLDHIEPARHQAIIWASDGLV